MQKINRRDFLKTTGLVFGTTLLLPYCSPSDKNDEVEEPLNFKGSIRGEKHKFGHGLRDKKIQVPDLEPETSRYDVVIVGGGISGLVTARKLQKEGFENFLIIEKEDKVGGLCRGEEHNGLPYACGAHYTDYPEPQMKAVNEIFDDCGIISGYDKDGWPIIEDRFLLRHNKHQIFVEDEWEPSDYPFNISSEEDEAELHLFDQLMDELSHWTDDEGRYAVGLPLNRLSNHPKVLALDKISMSEFLKNEGFTSELLSWYCNIWIIDEFGVGIDDCSAWAGVQFFRSKIKPEGKETPTVTFAKGLGYVSESLAKKLPSESIRTQQWAINIEQKENQVFTTIWDEQKQNFYKVASKKVVFALPKQQVYHIIPSLRKAGRNEFSDLHYAPWIVANVHLKQLPDYENSKIKWDNTIYDSWTMGYLNNQHQMENPPAPDEPHIVTLYGCYPDSTKSKRVIMENLGWEHWARTLLKELEIAHPDISELITQMDIWLWGHPMRQPVVGSVWGEQRKKMNEPFGNIHFSHVDVCGIPVAEEAIEHSVGLALKIVEELKRSKA